MLKVEVKILGSQKNVETCPYYFSEMPENSCRLPASDHYAEREHHVAPAFCELKDQMWKNYNIHVSIPRVHQKERSESCHYH